MGLGQWRRQTRWVLVLTQRLPLTQMQHNWAQDLNPIISNPLNSQLILKNVSLVAGLNTINHLLQKNLQGWNPTRVRSAVTIYDQQDTNPTPQLTLILFASAPAIIDLAVF